MRGHVRPEKWLDMSENSFGFAVFVNNQRQSEYKIMSESLPQSNVEALSFCPKGRKTVFRLITIIRNKQLSRLDTVCTSILYISIHQHSYTLLYLYIAP